MNILRILVTDIHKTKKKRSVRMSTKSKQNFLIAVGGNERGVIYAFEFERLSFLDW